MIIDDMKTTGMQPSFTANGCSNPVFGGGSSRWTCICEKADERPCRPSIIQSKLIVFNGTIYMTLGIPPHELNSDMEPATVYI